MSDKSLIGKCDEPINSSIEEDSDTEYCPSSDEQSDEATSSDSETESSHVSDPGIFEQNSTSCSTTDCPVSPNNQSGVETIDFINGESEETVIQSPRASPQTPVKAMKALTISDKIKISSEKLAGTVEAGEVKLDSPPKDASELNNKVGASTPTRSRSKPRTLVGPFESPYNTRLKAKLLREKEQRSLSEGNSKRGNVKDLN